MSQPQQDMSRAIIRGELNTVRQLLSQGYPLNDPPDTPPLCQAIRAGQTAIVKLLIEKGADVNRRAGGRQRTPLTIACKEGRAEMVRALIAAGADVNLRDKLGIPALCEAFAPGAFRVGIVRDLIRAGADVNAGWNDRNNILMQAARCGTPEMIRILVEAGAKVNAVNQRGTALTTAIREKRPDVVAALLQAGADPNLRLPDDLEDKEVAGKTALELARELKQRKIAALLEAAISGRLPPPEPAKETAAMADVPSLWKRLEKALKRKVPDVRKSLRRGAGEAQLRRLEAECGSTLPDDFRASYRLHDGQNGGAGSLIPDVFTGEEYELLSLEGIASEWRPWKDLIELGEFAGRECTPEEGVRSDWWHSGWIPFASNGGGDSLCLDLAPAPGGTPGQVISMNHESALRQRLAASFAEFLSRLTEHWEGEAAE